MSGYTEKESGPRGQKIGRAFGRDDSSFKTNEKESRNGKSMGGGVNNLSHSISGASAQQHVKGK
jgi:hypothetical protein